MRIPSVNEVKERLSRLYPGYPLSYFTEPARRVTNFIREKWQKGELKELTEECLLNYIKQVFEDYEKPSLQRVINATGVVIHTNLGRAPLAEKAIEEIVKVAKFYSNLEFNLEEGKRGSRYVHVEEILKEITGAEGAIVVNNNASAVLISLNTLAFGKEVIVSRGELVEIGGSFRIPEVMKWAGCILREVGTTNKTHLYDYEKAINENTGLLLKVHKSNFAIVGFTKEVSSEELVVLGRKYNLPVMEDLGSGCLIDLSKYGYPKEPTVKEILAAGVDIVTFSGDKLLGGPQAGIILGKKDLIEKIRKNPLNRALRIDKLTLAGLEVTLRLYRDENLAREYIPTLKMILTPKEQLKKEAIKLANRLKKLGLEGFQFKVLESSGKTGGGSLPLLDLPSFVVGVYSEKVSPQRLQEFLRKNQPPIITRIEEDFLVIDPRCLFKQDYPEILKAFKRLKDGV
ncbi:L-seryl-tRNA(Sec) selenium transferase [Thermodesulfobacterium sp. TA1]|uniref:L-seryl-tRNA(Sec) selenium transferase n=1 Tax=Thermodesulfobacterium sp. TA1 TaxID=2234087 RepID=UPI001231EAB3|nr:L-seryl-tRNA(Sec) selenium transferase [Thermodesulfobacterium sp. TA1]QER42372.1 L-seryl-tRNA(Sec) selenium transferase [Thermodesulfobacterium sp. TA1]